jgi:Mannosylglycerate hydrolase MGH1-like glycoside hydrolase domain
MTVHDETINGIDLGLLPQPLLADHPEWINLYWFSWRLAARNLLEHEGRRHMDTAWDGRHQWVWDTCFMALYGRYGEPQIPSVSSLDNFYHFQREDGFISMTYDFHAGKAVHEDRINPPLFAWVEWEYYQATGDASRFEKVIPAIEKHMDWIDANRRSPKRRSRLIPEVPGVVTKEEQERWEKDGYFLEPLYWFGDCGNSGMDNSPRTPRLKDVGHNFDYVDLSSQMVLSFRCLAKMQAAMGNDDKADHWQSRAESLAATINRQLWCERTGFYHDLSHGPNFVTTKTAAGFWPILAEIASPAQIDALIRHLHNPNTFGRPIPVPTLSYDDPNYCELGTYWIGGVWAPTNYMITHGLALAGRGEEGRRIAALYLRGLAETYANVEPHTLWECNSPEAPAPGRKPFDRDWVKKDFVGWSALGPVAMLIENILGISLNAPQQSLTWEIQETGEHGIKQLALGKNRIDLHCAARESENSPALITAHAASACCLEVRCGGRRTILKLAAKETRQETL